MVAINQLTIRYQTLLGGIKGTPARVKDSKATDVWCFSLKLPKAATEVMILSLHALTSPVSLLFEKSALGGEGGSAVLAHLLLICMCEPSAQVA